MAPTCNHPVLIVDDSLVFLKVLKTAFNKAGFEVVTARTGVEALVLAIEETFCAVVSDCQMPIMTGFQLCRLLKDEPETRHLPVVLITGTEQRLGRIWSRTCGADRFWLKRENYDHLIGVVSELIASCEYPSTVAKPHSQISMEDIQRRMSHVLERKVLELSLRHAIGVLGTQQLSVADVAWPLLDLGYDLVSPGALYCVLPTWNGHRGFGIHTRGLDPRAVEQQIGAFPWAHDGLSWEWKDYPSQDPAPTGGLNHSPSVLKLAGGDAWGQWGYLVEGDYPAPCVELLNVAQDEFVKVLQASVAVELMRGAITDLNRANIAKTEYVQTLCHEIRNPLTAAMGSVEQAMASVDAGSTLARQLGRSMGAMERQLYLLNVVLDVEKLEANGTDLARVEVNLEHLVQEAMMLTEGLAEKKGIGFKVNSRGTGPWILVGDPDRIHQCLLNLLGNAIKFGPSGTTVTLGLSREDDRVRIEVSDQGSGLPPGFEDKVFGKFQQGEASPGGTGLGLSITRRLVEAMGGAIGVQSPPGEGATFWIEFLAPCP